MDCPICHNDSKVIDSRPVDNSAGVTIGQRRRRKCVGEDSHRWTTKEFPEALLEQSSTVSITSRLAIVDGRVRVFTYVDGKLPKMTNEEKPDALAAQTQKEPLGAHPPLRPTETKTESLQTIPSSKPMALMPQSFQEMIEVSEYLSKSGLVPQTYQNKPADIFAAMQMGAELGIMPFAAVRNIDVIDGRPSLRARAIMGVCMAERDCEYFKEHSDTEYGVKHVWVCRRRGVDYRGEFGMENAKAAGLLGKSNWKGYGADMLENRAIARAGRKAYADKLAGVYTPDEIIDLRETPEGNFAAPAAQAAPVATAEPEPKVIDVVDEGAEDERRAKLDEIAQGLNEAIGKTKTREELSKLARQCKDLNEKSPEHGEAAKAVYKSHAELISHAQENQ